MKYVLSAAVFVAARIVWKNMNATPKVIYKEVWLMEETNSKARNVEEAIAGAIDAKLKDGTVERLVSEAMEKCIKKALDDLIGHFGDINKTVKEKLQAVMSPQLEGYDWAEHVVKLDAVLTEILKNTTLDHKKMLENFKELMVNQELPKVIKLSDIFEQFKKKVAKEIDTSNLEVNTDDRPSYEWVSVTMEVEEEEKKSYSSFQYARALFECEKDENMNFELRLTKFDNYPWHISVDIDTSISSLRRLDGFKIYLLKLQQARTDIEIDTNFMEGEVEPEAEPEVTFS